MAYASLDDLRAILPKNITIGNTVSFSPDQANPSTISVDTANRFLNYASQYVDSRLTPYYLTPLKQIVEARRPIISDMLPNSTDVMVEDILPFMGGMGVRLRDDNAEELNRIKEVPENFDDGDGMRPNRRHLTLLYQTVNAYDAQSNAKLEIVSYPTPVTPMTAEFAVALLYDKIFVADAAPDGSQYGVKMRNQALTKLNAIVTGQTRLRGQEFVGRRFVRQQLFDGFKSPGTVEGSPDKD
mgnify:CR=1 FL=1